jgi:hypothetical protein
MLQTMTLAATFKKILPPDPTAELDAIVAALTGFVSFADLTNSHPSYRPTLYVDDPRLKRVADAYDVEMTKRGDWRRAYRIEKRRRSRTKRYR